MTQEALKLALEALEEATERYDIFTKTHKRAITAIKEALAQPEQERDLSEQGRNKSAVLGNNVEAMVDAGLSFVQALDTTLKVYDHPTQKPEQEPVTYTGNGPAGREADVRPTGFFFQMPEQEPVACQHKRYSIDVHEQVGNCFDCGAEGRMRFIVGTPQRTWVGLDNDDLVWIYSNSDKVGQAISNTEAKLKEKNT